MQLLVYLIVIALVIGLISALIQAVVAALPFIMMLLAMVATVVILYKAYETAYFNGRKFKAMKARIEGHIGDCNELNEHIEELKGIRLGTDQTRYGTSDYHDNSKWNFRRPELKKVQRAANVYNCSRTVCDNSRRNPMQYICKYFGFKTDESTLALFEKALNDFSAVKDGKESLAAQREEIFASISGDVPGLIKRFSSKRLERELGFEEVDLSDAFYPVFKFQYVSPGGNASTENTIVMDIDNLNAMVRYINDRIKWNKSVAHQRSLMTSELRHSIIERDGYRCCNCGVGLAEEPHLLLEVDHIIPVSKGGITRADNLQTLCWRCNRSKGAKVLAVTPAEVTSEEASSLEDVPVQVVAEPAANDADGVGRFTL